jgi:DNA-binding CsgD family transcriptional regulator
MDRLDGLPQPQGEALATVFGLDGQEAPDRFMVAMAVASLLTRAASERPVLCIVDDAQWLDPVSAQALGFVARHLKAAAVGVAFSTCSSYSPELADVPELLVPGLTDDDLRALLGPSFVRPFDEQVQERIVFECRGNALTLQQATLGQGPDELAGGFGLPSPPVPDRMGRLFREQLASLPTATRRLLLLAAADPTGDAVLLWAAAGQLGMPAGAVIPATERGLLEIDGSVRFCHPLVRSVVYSDAAPRDRRSAHSALAQATEPADSDRRAWHLALASADADEKVADELERTAMRAKARGGLAALGAFLARAAALTADPADRARRALLAAEATHEAGSQSATRRLLAMAQAGGLDPEDRARAGLLRARAARMDRGADAASLLLQEGERLLAAKSELGQHAYIEAFDAALLAGRLCSRNLRDVASAGRMASAGSQDTLWLLLKGASMLATDDHAEGVQLVASALRTLLDQPEPAEDGWHWLPLACRVAQERWDERSWHGLAARLIDAARRTGALNLLPDALNSMAINQLLTAGCDAAIPIADEVDAVALATHRYVGPYARLMCAAWNGSLNEISRLIDEATPTLVARGEGAWLTATDVARAIANNGSGQYEDAMLAAEQGSGCRGEIGISTRSLVELIEAAVRIGAPERAGDVIERLTTCAGASGTEWGLGVLDRSRALLSDGETADHLYRRAIEHLARTAVRADLARAHLLYGEWLRREGRRVDARHQLRTAHEMLTQLGFDGFAERARRELVSTGGSPRKRVASHDQVLTAQEAQIAWMAHDGRTNSEIGVELYISPRTVEWHLRNVFMKLGIASRRELGHALPAWARRARDVFDGVRSCSA